ncbi:nucleotidyltransferase domain-containing protein [Wenzhouxiangella sp. AB-CW3]|uniref:nucleotidyltransferase domain-containing protein n=1 Tax=Wenzhouxiangella sp. AB-CW3 TaxID=2771012 RepID=UPI00168BBDF3|nr:nucleotidyltransferase domain-containing protein [Wenzhouxiangella sp. AB-CW3]QOC23760.1 nucleotidyltransferase domain-containing protein [Wenzhouxiangella sp. AB-CW3]
MRLNPKQIQTIKQATADIFGPDARVWLFGSRADDSRRGGDVDLMVETDKAPDNPALLAARLSARVSRSMYGRRVDVVVHAPGFPEMPIHAAARTQGVRL